MVYGSDAAFCGGVASELSTRDESEDSDKPDELEDPGTAALELSFMRLDCASAGGITTSDEVTIAAEAAAAARDGVR